MAKSRKAVSRSAKAAERTETVQDRLLAAMHDRLSALMDDKSSAEYRHAVEAAKAFIPLLEKCTAFSTDDLVDRVFEPADQLRTAGVDNYKRLGEHYRMAMKAYCTDKRILELDPHHPERIKASLALFAMQVIEFGVDIEPEEYVGD